MSIGDYIQTGIMLILAATLIALLVQMRTQNHLLKAQILGDRLEMYWKTFEPVTEEEISEFHLLIDDYMDKEKYDNYYKNEPEATRKYISLLSLYEYLAFTYSLKKLKLPDPMGYNWTERWAKDLLEYKEFRDVHEYHKDYYPEFGKFIDNTLKE